MDRVSYRSTSGRIKIHYRRVLPGDDGDEDDVAVAVAVAVADAVVDERGGATYVD